LTPEEARRLGALEARYARDLQDDRGITADKTSRFFENDPNVHEVLEKRYGEKPSVLAPERVWNDRMDLSDLAGLDGENQRDEDERRAAAARAAAGQTLFRKIKSAFNKIIGRSNAFGKTSKRTGRKKKYTKKSRHGFNGYHNPDH
jgi:hypothetical protein